MGMRLSGYNTENIAVDYRGCRGWRLPPSLHAKDLFCRFRKSVALQNTIILSLPNSPCSFSRSQKSLTRLTHSFLISV